LLAGFVSGRGMLGAELRKVREAAGLTQEKLAFAAKLSREYVNQLEQDHKSPTVKVLVRLCKAMDVRAWKVLRAAEEE
jgi:transcriptional regulator with XRE-family HTH domain